MVWFAANQGSTAFSLPFTIEDMLAEKRRETESAELESEQEEVEQLFPEHEEWCRRFHKTLYYGGKGGTFAANKITASRISLPVTELCVESFASATEMVAAAASSSSAILSGGASMVPLSGITMARAAEVTRGATGASPTSLVLALLYLDRLRTKNPGYLHNVSSADLFLVSLLVASKYLHDDGEEDEVFNDEWAEVGGLEKLDLKRLELGFLSALDWEAYAGPKEFTAMAEKLECAVALRQLASPLRRKLNAAAMTYTELCVLSRNKRVIRLAMETLAFCSIKVIAVCMTAYAASAMMLLGTACLLNRTSFGPNAFHSSMSTLMSSTASSDLQTPTPSSEVGAVEGAAQDDEANSTAAIHFFLRDSLENGESPSSASTLWGSSRLSSPQSDLNHHSTSVLISPDGKSSFLSSSLSLLNLWHKQVRRGWRSWGASRRPSSQCPWADFRIEPWFLPDYSQASSVLLYGGV